MTVYYICMKMVDQILEKVPGDCFTDTELKYILSGSPNRRYGLVKRALKNGQILQIRRGLYYLGKRYRRHAVNLYEIALRIYSPSFISLHSALSYYQLIPEAVYTTHSACARRSKQFETPMGLFSYFHFPEKDFFTQVDRVETPHQGVFLIARPWRAFFDTVFVNEKSGAHPESVMESLRMDHEEFPKPTRKEFQELQRYYNSPKMNHFIAKLQR